MVGDVAATEWRTSTGEVLNDDSWTADCRPQDAYDLGPDWCCEWNCENCEFAWERAIMGLQ